MLRNLIFIFALTLLGMIIFLMLWETNKKYNICFVPITIILMEQGIFHIIQKLNNDHKNQKHIIHIGAFITLSIGFIILSVIAFFDKGYYTDLKKENINYSFYRTENDIKYITDISKEQKKVIQTFSTSKKFNEIALHFVKKQTNTVGNNYYIINLLDNEQKVISSKTVTYNDFPKDGWVTLPVMKNIKNDKDKVYSIALSSIGQGDDFAKVVYTDSIVFDQYKNGKAYINGKSQPYDLSFRVYEKKMDSYYSTSLYLVSVISFLIIYGLVLIIIFVVILKEIGVIKDKSCVNILKK